MRVGLYPGTFDPVTNGHLDIIGRAVKLVDRLVIGVAVSEGKGPMFSLEERVEILREETARFGGATQLPCSVQSVTTPVMVHRSCER